MRSIMHPKESMQLGAHLVYCRSEALDVVGIRMGLPALCSSACFHAGSLHRQLPIPLGRHCKLQASSDSGRWHA